MSYKKLHDLLNPATLTPKEQSRNTPIINKSPLSGSHHLTPLGSNIGVGLTNTPPAYHSLPQGQNIFYNPMIRTQEPVCPSPMIQTPFRFMSRESLPTQQLNALHVQETYHNQSMDDMQNPNDVSTSLQSLLSQLQNHFPSQPKNLDELLQRSFSLPSNSVFQSSFTSALQSPFIGHNTPSSHHQLSAGSEFGKGLNSGLLGTPLQQNNHLFNGKQINPPQSNEAVQSMLISQLADLLKQENEKKIKSAIIELLVKYKNLGYLTDKILGKEMAHLEEMVHTTTAQQQNLQQFINPHNNLMQQQLPYPQHAQYPGNQKGLMQQLGQPNQAISLQGVIINPLPRHEEGKATGNGLFDFKNSIPSMKVEAARRGLFVMETIPEEQPRMNNPTSLFHQQQQQQQHQQHQPTLQLGGPSIMNMGGLNQQFDRLGLNNNAAQSDYEITQQEFEKHKGERLRLILEERAEFTDTVPGIYTQEERIDKILKYKGKIKKHRYEHPVNRSFGGRSMVAGKKPRIKGKFVKPEEYEEYIKSQVKKDEEGERLNWTQPVLDDNLNESTTYNDSEKSIKSTREIYTKEEAY